tara:strand:- start:6219 stop:6821 length:603 start_codon:yes stop_codon:yes gene_type:complete
MQVILLERVEKLGNLGDIVTVKPGYARNYLLPQSKAMRANKDNLAYFDAQKKQLEADNAKRKTEAEKKLKKVDGVTVALIRQASEGGQLYGSVAARDIANILNEKVGDNVVHRKDVIVEENYKTLGLYDVRVMLHPEVIATVTINIARTPEEAEVQEKRGEALVTEEHEPDLATQAIEELAADQDAETAEGDNEEEKPAA